MDKVSHRDNQDFLFGKKDGPNNTLPPLSNSSYGEKGVNDALRSGIKASTNVVNKMTDSMLAFKSTNDRLDSVDD